MARNRRAFGRRIATACLTAPAMLAAAGCDASPAENGRVAAENALKEFTALVNVRVVMQGGGTSQQRFVRLRDALLDPKGNPRYGLAEADDPTWQVLLVTPTDMDIAVWAYGESGSLIGADNGGMGHVCARYRVASDRLVSTPQTCPAGLPESGG